MKHVTKFTELKMAEMKVHYSYRIAVLHVFFVKNSVSN